MRKLELLAPAKNLQCGIAAIDCGADAVYIGAPKFGARAAAGNSLEDIAELTRYAHQFGARVFVTLNTIVYDDELEEVRDVLLNIYKIGVDAVLVQDMALVSMVREMNLPLTLHASTQTDNRDKEKVGWLRSQGFERVVLARELSLDEIREIHSAYPDVELEAFVHGALCVSYSGACYASQHCFDRSANRGECAQFCRMKFDLLDADGKEIEHQRYLLSLKDLCQIDRLEQMADAGVVSFKIEGRLKDESYVRNVVAAYSKKLNELCEKRPDEFERASYGRVTYAFEPNLKKTFNRGYTHYFLDGRKPDIFSPDTPKAIGEYVGKVKEIRGKSFNVAGTASFVNGDGLCFINSRKELEGFRVNRVEGNRLFPLRMPENIKPGTALYRNNDEAFEKELNRQGTERKLLINLVLSLTDKGFALSVSGKGISAVSVDVEFEHQQAKQPQKENIIRQLSKWGSTIFEANDISVSEEVAQCFIPSSILSALRQELLRQMELSGVDVQKHTIDKIEDELVCNDCKNISNSVAEQFYKDHAVKDFVRAYETNPESFTLPLMQCRHCLRYSLGYCVKRGGAKPTWKEPLTLRLGDGRRFRLQFDCSKCQMNVYAE